jgi:hypothetical protein
LLISDSTQSKNPLSTSPSSIVVDAIIRGEEGNQMHLPVGSFMVGFLPLCVWSRRHRGTCKPQGQRTRQTDGDAVKPRGPTAGCRK